METAPEWAEASVYLIQSESDLLEFPGCPDVESALVYLTHPLADFMIEEIISSVAQRA